MKQSRFHSNVKAWAVASYSNRSKTVAQIAMESGASRPAVYQWINAARQPAHGTLLQRVAKLEARVAMLTARAKGAVESE